jgi:hypothetical protein
MVRTFRVEAKSKGRMVVRARIDIITEPGTLTQGELATLKTRLADKLMLALADVPYLHVCISEIKVTR